MGICHNVDELLGNMGLGNLATMDYPTYLGPCKDSISTISLVHSEDNTLSLTFVIGMIRYFLSMKIFCRIYGFPRRDFEETPIFNQESNEWKNIALHEPFESEYAQLS